MGKYTYGIWRKSKKKDRKKDSKKDDKKNEKKGGKREFLDVESDAPWRRHRTEELSDDLLVGIGIGMGLGTGMPPSFHYKPRKSTY
jgi:hypothetical protein